ncbi:GumC family protein [Dysgonomonas sp.]
MEQLRYIYTFIDKIKWWLLIAPLLVAGLVMFFTRHLELEYNVETTIYTGVISGYSIESEEAGVQNWNILNNTLANIINIITSKETLKDVGLKLYVQHMIHGDPKKDNTYIKASNYNKLISITPKDVLKLIDKTSEEKTLENLLAYEKTDPKNFIYGLLNWHHPHYSYEALSKITAKKLGNSDMLEITYSANDPGIAYNTLLILSKSYEAKYKEIQFGSTNNVIHYLEQELAKVSVELKNGEDSLTNYNIENRIINYDEQTKHIAAYDKDFELIYQDVLLRYNSSKALIGHLESQISENVKLIKNNSDFLNKLQAVSLYRTRIAEIEPFYTDSVLPRQRQIQLDQYKKDLKAAENDLRTVSSDISSQKYTKDGYPTSNFISQWIEELLKNEQASAELKVLNQRRTELDQKYLHFSPIGSTIKRKERSIDFLERSYLSILSSLNTARLRLKSLEMNSASLKVLNPPTYPLVSQPTKRKAMVLGAYVGSLIFILGLFLIKELFNRRLLDRLRTEHLTSNRVLLAYPGEGKLKNRIYRKSYEDTAIMLLGNNLLNYFETQKPNIINFISIDHDTQKNQIANGLSDYWNGLGLSAKNIDWKKDNVRYSKDYLLAKDLSALNVENTEDKEDVIILEFPPVKQNPIPKKLLQIANFNLILLDANKIWKESDQAIFNEIKRISGDTPVMICLTNADYKTVENITGIKPSASE